MRKTVMIAAMGCSLMVLAGCKQETNNPAPDAASTIAVPVPGPTSTEVVAVPVPGPTSTKTEVVVVPGPTVTETATPKPTPTPE